MADFDFSYKPDENNDNVSVKFISGPTYYNIYSSLRKMRNVKIVTSGSMRQVWFPDGTIKTYFIKGFTTPGTHICYHVLKDVRKRIQSGEYSIKYDIDTFRNLYIYNTLFDFWNIQGIRGTLLNYNGYVKAVDINYCYWNVLRKIGAIGDHVFQMGLKKKTEWKLARNMAVGSTSKKHTVQIIKDDGSIETFTHQSELAGVRLEVVAYVYEMAVAIAKALGNKFCFFFTDCFFVRPDAVDEAIDMIREFGFETKVNDERIINITKKSENSYTMEWERLKKQKDNNGKRVVVSNTLNTKSLIGRLPNYKIINGKSVLQNSN